MGYRLINTELPQPPPDPRPRFALLPFHNESGDSDAECYADGIVADIITALSQFRAIAVVSRNFFFIYKVQARDTRGAAAAIGARYRGFWNFS